MSEAAPQPDQDPAADAERRPPPGTIELAGIVLRRWRPEWAEPLQDAVEASLPELRQFMAWATDDHDLEQSRAFIARSVTEWDAGDAWNYAIFGPDDALVGAAGMMTRMGPGVIEIGYWIHSAHAGCGYATMAAAALSEVALGMLGVDRAAIKHDAANPASGRVAEKAGYVHAETVSRDPEAPGDSGVDWVWERRT